MHKATSPVSVLLGLLALAQPAAADRLDEVKVRGKLLVGVSDTTPPFSFKKSDGTITGYDIDLVKAVARRLKVELEMTPLSSAERIAVSHPGARTADAPSRTRPAGNCQTGAEKRTLGRIFAHALVRHPQLIPVAARFFL